MAGLSKFSCLRASVLFKSFRAPSMAVPSPSFPPNKPTYGFCTTDCQSSLISSGRFGWRSFHGGNETQKKKGIGIIWTCTGCNFINFDRNMRCLKCRAAGPSPVATVKDEKKEERKLGTWICQCRFVNLAINNRCLLCRMPDMNLQPKDCQCALCLSLNNRREMFCAKCYKAANQRHVYFDRWKWGYFSDY